MQSSGQFSDSRYIQGNPVEGVVSFGWHGYDTSGEIECGHVW